MGQQTTVDSYSGAMASGVVDAWAGTERGTAGASPADRYTARDGSTESKPERFTTFGYVEYPPHE
ncbi:hypothetical protein [Halobaculum litoreum]|uniref:Uncharacterized protein n=1 Tax=Halobaculum litoreum TaxID=3031998 RepID=A0ABD5XPX5_9EURY|nr:hypothetical protein [Halobaculum sp. DT92]